MVRREKFGLGCDVWALGCILYIMLLGVHPFDPSGESSEAAILAHCGLFLPPAKTPKEMLIVPELPKSDRGKVLRDKLRDDWLARHKVTA